MPQRINWKKRLIKLVILLSVLFVIGFGIALYLQYRLMKKSEQTFYKAFGISIPTKYKLHGIDVSRYQSYIYWTSVKQMKIDSIGIDFAFIKATEGTNDVDAMFKRNWELSNASQIPCGAYHYFIAAKDGKQQADNYIKNIALTKGNLPPVVDIEQDFGVSENVLKKRLRDYLNRLEQHYKVKPIIYSYVDFYNNYLGQDFNDYPLWIAHYTEDKMPAINRNWLFWQHSDCGRVNGITEKVDFNVFNGDSLMFANLLLK